MDKIKLNLFLEQVREKFGLNGTENLAEDAEKARIGVIFDDDGVVLSLRLADSSRLDAVKFIAYSKSEPLSEVEKVQFLLSELPAFYPQYADCEFWLGIKGGELCLVDLPLLNGEELDSVALLQASQQIKFEPQEALFDYRLVNDKGHALALVLPKASCLQWQNAFEQAKLPLVGLTSRKLAAASLFTKGIDSSPWANYAVCHMADNVSVLTLIDHDEPVLIRTFNFGFNRLLGDVVDRLLEQSDSSASALSAEALHHAMLARAKVLFREKEPSLPEQQALSTALQAHAHRAVQYIERTFNYYERVEHRLMPEGVILVTDESVSDALSREIEDQLGLSCLSKRTDVRLSEGVLNDIENIRDRFKSASMFEAISLVFSGDTIPNVLDLSVSRRAKQKKKEIEQWVKRLTVGACVVALGCSAYFGLSWWFAQKRVNQLEAQLEKISKPLTVEVLEQKVQSLKRYEGQVQKLADKQRFVSLLAQLDAMRSENLFLTAVDFKQNDSQQNAVKNAAKDTVYKQELMVSIVLVGNAQEREASLAHFINRLEKLVQGGVIKVTPVKSSVPGAAYVIRLSGRF